MNRRWSKDEIFREECRRRIRMPLAQRLLEGFINRSETHLPERTDRSFETMAEYRRWSHENLPPHMGFRLTDGPDETGTRQ